LPSKLEPAASILAFATFGNLVGNICRAACRPKLVLQVGGFDQKYPSAGDYEGWQRVAGSFGISLQNEELVFERIHEFQDSSLASQKHLIDLQVNSILHILAKAVDPQLLTVLKRHWTVHFFSPRFSYFIRQISAGNLHQAMSTWQGIPLGISFMNCIAAYPIFKFKSHSGHSTTAKLLENINKLNNKYE